MMLSQEDPITSIGGSFGLWHAGVFLLAALVKVPSAWHMLGVLFKAPTVDFWCVQPKNLSFLPMDVWISLSHPIVTINNIMKYRDPCEIYNVDYEDILSGQQDKEVNIDDFMKNLSYSTPRKPCQEFKFDNSIFQETVVTEWHLVCNRKILVSVSQGFYLFGILMGGLISLLLIPRVGCRWVVLSGAVIQIVAGTLTAYVQFLEMNIALRFSAAFGCAFMFTGGYIICRDITWGKSRILTCAFYEWFWSLGVMSLPLMCYIFGTKSWRPLQIAISVPTCILLLIAFFCLPESPRWLLENNKIAEAEKIVRRMAKVNRRPVPDNQNLNLMKDFQVSQGPSAKATNNKQSAVCDTLMDLFRGQNKKKMIPLFILWAATVVTYYGALLNVKNLGNNLFLNVVIAGIAEIVGVTCGALIILYKNSQKWEILGSMMIIGGLSCICSWFLFFDMDPVTLQPINFIWWHQCVLVVLAMAGRIAIACSLTILQLSSTEFVPKESHHVLAISAVTFARIFLLSAPFIGALVDFGTCVPLSAFGGITIIGGISSIFLSLSGKSHSNNFKQKISGFFTREKTVWTIENSTARNGIEDNTYYNQNFNPE